MKQPLCIMCGEPTPRITVLHDDPNFSLDNLLDPGCYTEVRAHIVPLCEECKERMQDELDRLDGADTELKYFAAHGKPAILYTGSVEYMDCDPGISSSWQWDEERQIPMGEWTHKPKRKR